MALSLSCPIAEYGAALYSNGPIVTSVVTVEASGETAEPFETRAMLNVMVFS